MARDFNGSSQYLDLSSAVVSADGFAVAAWVYPASVSGNYGVFCASNPGPGGARWQFDQNNGTVRALSVNDNGSAVGTASATGTLSAGAWQHVAGVFAGSADRRALRDGGNRGTSATSVSVTPVSRTSVGVLAFSSIRTAYWSGRLAEVAVYDLSAYPGATAALRADEWEASVLPALAKGVSPTLFPLGLINYWPLIGRASPEPDLRGTAALTVTGATAADHPRVYRGGKRRAVFVPVSGGASDAAGSSSLTLAASATGSSLAAATGSSSLTLAASATGSALAAATGSAALTFAASAAGSALAAADGSAALTFAGSGVGSALADASGSAALTLAGSAAGSALASADASSALTFAASAVGSTGESGSTGTAAVTFAASAVGSSLASATGAASLTFAASASSPSTGGSVRATAGGSARVSAAVSGGPRVDAAAAGAPRVSAG